jgi:hypothetical protein
MKTCEKCGSEKLKYGGNDNASGVDKEMYQCQDCGHITFFLVDRMYKYKITCLWGYAKIERIIIGKNQAEALRVFLESMPEGYIEGSYSIIIDFVKKIS